MRSSRWLPVAAVLAFCVVSGCTCGNGDEIEAVPFPSTLTLSAKDLRSLAKETTPGTLVFSPPPPGLAGVKRGSVIVAGISEGSPSGLLRLVRSVENDGTTMTLLTVQAPLPLAFKKLHAKMRRETGEIGPTLAAGAPASGVLSRRLPPANGVVAGGGEAEGTLTLDATLFDGDGDRETKDDRVELKGELSGTLEYKLNLDLDWGDVEDLPEEVLDCVTNVLVVLEGGVQTCVLEALLPEPKTSFDVTSHLAAKTSLEGAAVADFEKEFTLFTAPLPPIPLGPLVFTPSVDAIAKVEGGASARFSVGVHASADLEMGVDITGKDNVTLRPPKLTKTDFGADAPKATLAAHAEVSVGARLKVPLYGVVGPHAAFSIYGKIDANIDENPCWTVKAGAETELGVRITTPELPLVGALEVFKYSAPSLKLLDLPIADGACIIPPSPNKLPPGSGPDEVTLGKPTFTPWSKLVSSPVDASEAPAPGNDGTGWTDLFRTIDGRYLVSGSGSHTLFKFDETGAVTWARTYDTPLGRARLMHAVDTLDAETVVVTQSPASPLGLLKMNQAGEPLFHRGLDLAFAGCSPYARSTVRDSATGFWVTGGCVERSGFWLAHLDAQGTLISASGFEDESGAYLVPTTLVRVQSDVVMAGSISGAPDRMFVVRVDESGAVKHAQRYLGCMELADLSPTAGVSGSNGDVTLVGSAGGHRSGFLARIRPDASVAFANFTGFGGGLSNVFVINSVTELPTTGYVVGGSTVELLGDARTSTPGVALASLDAVGNVIWSRRYSAARPSMPFTASGFPGLRLTDDGGAMFAAVAHDGTANGHIWAAKVFAKDGSVAFSPGAAQVDPLAVKRLDCTLTGENWPAKVSKLSGKGSVIATTSAKVTLSTTALTP